MKAVLKFAASGHVQELLSYLTVIFKTANLELSNSDRIHLSNLTLMAYFQQALASEVSVTDELRGKLIAFLDANHWFDECLAVRLAAETREWKLLGKDYLITYALLLIFSLLFLNFVHLYGNFFQFQVTLHNLEAFLETCLLPLPRPLHKC